MRSTILLLSLVACAGTKRDVATYRTDTQRVLETRNTQVSQCYEKELATDPSARGTIGVKFVVEKKTGAFVNAIVDPATTKASESLTLCVLSALAGLHLEPPDRNEGQASFIYVLEPTG